MKILLTGIHGFVGVNLVKGLRDDHALYGIDIIPSVPEGVLQVHSWDQLILVPESDVVIHLAGKAHDTKNTPAGQEYFDINVGLTKRIFDHFLSTNAQKFIFFSSVKAVADTVPGDELTEEAIPAPLTAYGRSKLEAERYILSKQVPADESLSTNQIVALMAESLKMKERIWHIHPKAITLFARLGDKLNLTMNSERLKKLTESYVVSNKKIKHALDLGRMPVTAAEGMRETLEAFNASA